MSLHHTEKREGAHSPWISLGGGGAGGGEAESRERWERPRASSAAICPTRGEARGTEAGSEREGGSRGEQQVLQPKLLGIFPSWGERA